MKTAGHTIATTRVRNGVAQSFPVTFKEKEISPWVSKSGYLVVAGAKSGKRSKVFVHRLIGMAFVGGYAPDLTINHINGNKLDNRAENLEWVSVSRNSEHAWETGLVDLRGELHPGSKLTTKRVVYIRKLLQMGVAPHTIAIVADMSDSLIYLIRDGKRWAHLEAAVAEA